MRNLSAAKRIAFQQPFPNRIREKPVDMIKQFYAQYPDRVDVFKHTLLEKQAINLIIDKSSIEEVEPELEKPVDDKPAD